MWSRCGFHVLLTASLKERVERAQLQYHPLSSSHPEATWLALTRDREDDTGKVSNFSENNTGNWESSVGITS